MKFNERYDRLSRSIGSRGDGDGEGSTFGASSLRSPQELAFSTAFDRNVCQLICPDLTLQQRMYGFCGCFGMGWIISFLSMLTLPQIKEHPEKFAFLYTLGNLLAIGSSLFLWGFKTQCTAMFKRKRIIATFLYFLAIGLTLYFAFTGANFGLILLCLLVQFLAMTWYGLSYIPYARTLIKKCCMSYCE